MLAECVGKIGWCATPLAQETQHVAQRLPVRGLDHHGELIPGLAQSHLDKFAHRCKGEKKGEGAQVNNMAHKQNLGPSWQAALV